MFVLVLVLLGRKFGRRKHAIPRANMTSLVTPRTKLGGGEAESTFRRHWYVEFIPVIAIDGINE